jgi:acetolactate synthase-1/2/3 large subunit
MPHAGRLLVECLAANGVTHAFGVPGESFLPVLDGMYGPDATVRFIAARHEAGAANMAIAAAKLTGVPGVCMVSRGPGAFHAAIGVHTAQQDSAPLILFIGQIARIDRDREAFQEVDYRRVFGGVAKWVSEIESAERIPELIARAISVATGGRPGPVVLALPENVLLEDVEAVPLAAAKPHAPAPHPASMAAVAKLLDEAQRPIALVGRMGWSEAAARALAAFAARTGLPVATGFRSKDQFPNHHPNYAGDLGLGVDPALAERVKSADLVLAIGLRLDENTTNGYTLLDCPTPRQKLVHVLPASDQFGIAFQPTLAITADTSAFVLALAELPVSKHRWPGQSEAAHAAYLKWAAPVEVAEGVNLSKAFAHVDALAPEAILCNGAGNFAAWLRRHTLSRRLGTQLAPMSGAMGFGVPAAVAAKILNPDRVVVCAAGDGDFLMSGHEIAAGVAVGARPIFIVADNGVYGTILMHQEREFPGRESGVAMPNGPDFAALGRGYGLSAWTAQTDADFAAAFDEALAGGQGGLIHCITSPREILPGKRI